MYLTIKWASDEAFCDEMVSSPQLLQFGTANVVCMTTSHRKSCPSQWF